MFDLSSKSWILIITNYLQHLQVNSWPLSLLDNGKCRMAEGWGRHHPPIMTLAAVTVPTTQRGEHICPIWCPPQLHEGDRATSAGQRRSLGLRCPTCTQNLLAPQQALEPGQSGSKDSPDFLCTLSWPSGGREKWDHCRGSGLPAGCSGDALKPLEGIAPCPTGAEIICCWAGQDSLWCSKIKHMARSPPSSHTYAQTYTHTYVYIYY